MQFWEAMLFASKAKIEGFFEILTELPQRTPQREEKFSKGIDLYTHFLLHYFSIFSLLCTNEEGEIALLNPGFLMT